MIYGPLVHHIRMAIPPAHPADIGAEFDWLSARCLHQLLSTVATAVNIRSFFYMRSSLSAHQVIAATKGRNLIFGETE
jgi:hypothetical protein